MLLFTENIIQQTHDVIYCKMINRSCIAYLLNFERLQRKFEPQVVKTGSKIALASSAVFVILLLTGLFFQFKSLKVEH